MAFYELTKGRHLRNNQTLGPGDILEFTEEQAERFGLHRLRYIGEDLEKMTGKEIETKEPEKKVKGTR